VAGASEQNGPAPAWRYSKTMRIVLLSLVLALFSQGIDAPRISQADFKKLFTSKNVIIVDTRNEAAFSASHIPGAIKLPLEGLPTWPPEYEKTVSLLLSATKPIVTYCA
jgi:predicted sulfurtransferase